MVKEKIKKRILWCAVLLAAFLIGAGLFVDHYGSLADDHFLDKSKGAPDKSKNTVSLPPPKHSGKVSVEEAIFKRRSIRSYKNEPLTLQEVSQLLWAAGGKTIDAVTGATRAYPSAGGIYPLEIYLVAGEVEGLAQGIYHYNWQAHTIKRIVEGDRRQQLMRATLRQRAIADAPASIVITAVYSKTISKYGKRGEVRYVHMDTGGAGQNIYLQAEALGLGTVIIGAFQDKVVKEILGVKGEEPLYIMPVGKKP